jgi:hypothetical protein
MADGAIPMHGDDMTEEGKVELAARLGWTYIGPPDFTYEELMENLARRRTERSRRQT